jgi:hypothetical protein
VDEKVGGDVVVQLVGRDGEGWDEVVVAGVAGGGREGGRWGWGCGLLWLVWLAALQARWHCRAHWRVLVWMQLVPGHLHSYDPAGARLLRPAPIRTASEAWHAAHSVPVASDENHNFSSKHKA